MLLQLFCLKGGMCDTYLHVREWISYQVFHSCNEIISGREEEHTQSHIFSTLFKADFMLAKEADRKTFVSILTPKFSSPSGKCSQCKQCTL